MSVFQVRTRTFGAHVGASTVAIHKADQKSYGVQLVSLFAADVSGSASTLTVEFFDASEATAYRLAFEAPIPANGAYALDLSGMALDRNDEIRLTAGAANSVDALLTVKEPEARSR